MGFQTYPQGREPERYRNNPNYSQNEPYTSNNPKVIDLEEAMQLTLEDYGFTPESIKAYMFGLVVEDPKTGEEMPDEFYEHAIEGALSAAEQNLDIAIFPRIEEEYHDYREQEFQSYMHLRVHRRPIIQLEEFVIEMNGRTMFNLPPQGWKVYHLEGHLAVSFGYMGMSQGMSQGMGQAISYMNHPMTNAGGYGRTSAPQMIRVKYLAGLLPRENAAFARKWEAPATLEKYVLKIATREIMQLWGKLLVEPGSAGGTLTMDGITETRRTTASAMYSAVSAELNQIDQEINSLEKSLRSYFGSNKMISV